MAGQRRRQHDVLIVVVEPEHLPGKVEIEIAQQPQGNLHFQLIKHLQLPAFAVENMLGRFSHLARQE